jgi:F0F1-type ATP synthase assembly protein I
MESKVTPEFDIVSDKRHIRKKKKIESKLRWESRDGLYLVTPILIGLAAGRALDQYVGRGTTFTLIFLIAGLVASLYNLWKLIHEINR